MDISKIEFVYFDIGGVMINDFSKNNKWEQMMADLGIAPELADAIGAQYKELAVGIDAGKITTDELQSKIADRFSLELPAGYSMLHDFVERFERNPSVHPVVESLQDRVQVGLLTNMYLGMLDMIRERKLLPEITWNAVVDSSVVGLAKPQREIYELAEEVAGFSGEQIFFIDNLEKNIEAAQELGWQTFLYDPADHEGSSRELGEFLKV